MGRAALGAAAKTKTGSVRITEAESDYFTRTYGSIGRFLQIKVNEELQRIRQLQDISPRQEMK